MTDEYELSSLKYVTWKVLWRIVLYFILPPIIIFYVFVILSSKNSLIYSLTSKTIGVSILILMIVYIIKIIFTKEIKLYRNKITQVMCFGINISVYFDNCRVDGMKTPFFSVKKFFSGNTWPIFAPIFGVVYDENLSKPSDVKVFNDQLSVISGREPSEFHGNVVKMKTFYKEN